MFDKDNDHFELLIELGTNLRIWYKDMDQFNDLLKIIVFVDINFFECDRKYNICP